MDEPEEASEPRDGRELARQAAWDRAGALLGEHFKEFAIIAAPDKDTLNWEFSDRLWVRGAIQVVLDRFRDQNYMDTVDRRREEQN